MNMKTPLLRILGVQILVALSVVVMTALERPAFSADQLVKDKLEALVGISQKTSREFYRLLSAELRKDQEKSGSIDFKILNANLLNFKTSLVFYKTQLEAAAEAVEFSDGSSHYYWDVVSKEYQQYLGLLYRVVHQYGKKVSLKEADIEKLFLEVSPNAAALLQRVVWDVANIGSFASYDITSYFEPSPNNPAKRRLVFSPDAVIQHYGAALMAHPSEAEAKNALRREGIKILFAERASLLNFMYPNEKVERTIPEKAEPWMRAKWEHSDQIRQESLVRDSMTIDWFQPITDHVRKGLKKLYTSPGIGPDLEVSRGGLFFNSLATRYADKLSPKLLNDLLGDVDLVRTIKENGLSAEQGELLSTKVFVKTLVDTYRSAFWKLVLASPYHLTLLSDRELENFLSETARMAHYQVLSEFVFAYFFERSGCKAGPTRCLSEKEVGDIRTILAQWVESNVVPLKDAHVVKVFNRTRNLERAIAIRRYAMADGFVTAGLAYWGTEFLLGELAKMDSSTEAGLQTPVNLLPENPDIRRMLSLTMPDAPKWIQGLVQWALSDIDQTKKQSQRNQLKARVWAMLDYVDGLYDVVQEGQKDREVQKVFREIDGRLKNRKPYAWHSTRLRMAEFYRAIQTTQNPDSRAFKTINAVVRLQNVLQIIFSQTAIAVTEEHIAPILASLLGGSRTSLDKSRKIFSEGREYLKMRPNLLITLFGPPSMRKEEFRTLLKNPTNYKEYLEGIKSDVVNDYPGLFLALPYPTRIGGVELWQGEKSRPKAPITLAEIIRVLAPKFCSEHEKASCDSGMFAQLSGGGTSWIKSLAKRAKKKSFDSEFDTPIEVPQLIEAVAGEYSTTPTGRGLVLWLLDKGTGDDRQTNGYFSSKFLARDFYGAAFHKNSDGGSAHSLSTGLRVVVSQLMGAFLKAAEEANYRNLTRLMNNPGDDIRFLLLSNAFGAAQKAYGDEAGRLFQKLKDDELYWEKKLEQVQAKLHDVGPFGHLLFLALPVIKSPGLHVLAGSYFGFSAAGNLAIDSMTFLRVYDDLSTVEPYTRSALLDNSLSGSNELQGLRMQAESVAQGLFNMERIGWDFIMSTDAIAGGLRYRFAKKENTAALNALGLSMRSVSGNAEKALGVVKSAYETKFKEMESAYKSWLDSSSSPQQQKMLEQIRSDMAKLTDHYLFSLSAIHTGFQPWSESGVADVKEVREALDQIGLKAGELSAKREEVEATLETLQKKHNERMNTEMVERFKLAKTDSEIMKIRYEIELKSLEFYRAYHVVRGYVARSYTWTEGGRKEINEDLKDPTYAEYKKRFEAGDADQKDPKKRAEYHAAIAEAHRDLGVKESDFLKLESYEKEIAPFLRKRFQKLMRELSPDFTMVESETKIKNLISDYKKNFQKKLKREPTEQELAEESKKIYDAVRKEYDEAASRVSTSYAALQKYYKARKKAAGDSEDAADVEKSKQPEPPKGPLQLPPGRGE